LGGALLVLSAVGYAFSWAPFSLSMPTAGTPVSASSFQTNYTAIQNKVTELQNAIRAYTNPGTGQAYSLNTAYCNLTAAVTGAVADGALTGIAATKSLCQKACSNSPTAHMCNAQELQRWFATGGMLPGNAANIAGWYSSGLWTYDGAHVITDCSSWTNNTNTVTGPVAYTSDPAHGDFCNKSFPIVCCD
jgi:hypothetical protein